MTDSSSGQSEKLAQAKAKLVAQLLTPEEVQQVSGADGSPHWKEFTKFVMEPINPMNN